MDSAARWSLATQATEIVAFLNDICGIEWADCKLSNLVVDTHSVPGIQRFRAVDFGESLRIDGSVDWPDEEAEKIPGTLGENDAVSVEYCAPERLLASKSSTPLQGQKGTDAWSLGVLLFTIFAGGTNFWAEDEDPFEVLADKERLAKHIEKKTRDAPGPSPACTADRGGAAPAAAGEPGDSPAGFAAFDFQSLSHGDHGATQETGRRTFQEALAASAEHRRQVDEVLRALQPTVPLPSSILVEAISWNLGFWEFTDLARKEVLLTFTCARGTGKTFELRSREWKRWVRLSLSFLKAGVASYALLHGAMPAAATLTSSIHDYSDSLRSAGESLDIMAFCRELSNEGSELTLDKLAEKGTKVMTELSKLCETWGEADLDHLLNEAILLPSEQEVVIAELRVAGFFKEWSYDGSLPGWSPQN